MLSPNSSDVAGKSLNNGEVFSKGDLYSYEAFYKRFNTIKEHQHEAERLGKHDKANDIWHKAEVSLDQLCVIPDNKTKFDAIMNQLKQSIAEPFGQHHVAHDKHPPGAFNPDQPGTAVAKNNNAREEEQEKPVQKKNPLMAMLDQVFPGLSGIFASMFNPSQAAHTNVASTLANIPHAPAFFPVRTVAAAAIAPFAPKASENMMHGLTNDIVANAQEAQKKPPVELHPEKAVSYADLGAMIKASDKDQKNFDPRTIKRTMVHENEVVIVAGSGFDGTFKQYHLHSPDLAKNIVNNGLACDKDHAPEGKIWLSFDQGLIAGRDSKLPIFNSGSRRVVVDVLNNPDGNSQEQLNACAKFIGNNVYVLSDNGTKLNQLAMGESGQYAGKLEHHTQNEAAQLMAAAQRMHAREMREALAQQQFLARQQQNGGGAPSYAGGGSVPLTYVGISPQQQAAQIEGAQLQATQANTSLVNGAISQILEYQLSHQNTGNQQSMGGGHGHSKPTSPHRTEPGPTDGTNAKELEKARLAALDAVAKYTKLAHEEVLHVTGHTFQSDAVASAPPQNGRGARSGV